MKLGYVIVYVDDVIETINFYKDAFDMEISMKYEENGKVDYAEMKTEGAILGFASHEMVEENLHNNYQKTSIKNKAFGQEIVFVTSDIQEVYNKAILTGATEVKKPSKKPWGQIVAYLRAKEGTLIELCTPIN